MRGPLHPRLHEALIERGDAALDCKRAVHDAYNRRIDAGNLRMAWGAAERAHLVQERQGPRHAELAVHLMEYWSQTRVPNPEDYEFLR